MPSDKHNLITAKVMPSAQEVPFGIPQCVQYILHRITSVFFCVPFIFADSKRCQFGGIRDGYLCITEIVNECSTFQMIIDGRCTIRIFTVTTLFTEVFFEQFL